MERHELERNLRRMVLDAEENRIGDTKDPVFDAPLLCVAAAEDPLFRRMREPELVGERFLLPRDWLPAAKTVLSVFFPFSEAVRKSNRAGGTEISFGWLFARIEGHALLDQTMQALARLLQDEGYTSVIPASDPRFWSGVKDGRHTSAWSERHVAFVTGHGTFGLSRGLITRRGMAGRFGSLVTDAYFRPDEREYEDVYEYCNRCGACVRRCPAGAISLERGKDNLICSGFVDETKVTYAPRYGCGKCQIGVPCEAGRPVVRDISSK